MTATPNISILNLQEQVNVLTTEKTKLETALNTANEVNSKIGCINDKIKLFLDEVQSRYVVDGKWVTLNIFEWVRFGKFTFTFVKDVLSTCFNVTFNPRLPSWISQVIDFITKYI